MWTFPPIPDTATTHEKNMENAKKRSIKDIVGSSNLDIPMLDTKRGINGPEYCDLMVITEQLPEWEKAMADLYTVMGNQHEKKPFRTTGFQIVWTDAGNPVVSITFYPRKGKFIVHPRARQAERII